jgi:hypothetical protein
VLTGDSNSDVKYCGNDLADFMIVARSLPLEESLGFSPECPRLKVTDPSGSRMLGLIYVLRLTPLSLNSLRCGM